MSITYYLLQIPPLVFFVSIIIVGAISAGLGTYFFHKYVKLKVLRSHNEVTGFFFTAIASLYSLLLGFVVFVVWGQLNETQGNVSIEGSSAMGLYRDIKFYPDTIEAKELMTVYLDFVFNVVNEEIPNMGLMKTSQKTAESFNQVFYKIEHLNPKNQFQIQLVAEMFHHLNELATYRELRTSSIEAEIPPIMWLPIILGALITLICSLLVDIENLHIHIILNSLLGAFIGMLFFIIIILDHPFTGNLSIKPESYMQIFTMEHWADEGKVKS
ncbi:MAG: hypothetical protein A2W98_03970 [Bacteroidetes bacterium GWF2_33_38]|nr:MAG: hypothetical protein A2W98_03970 [Bacteroidetes bacterium GWF2_33_38]OFY76211.1 MAG: hypothetical protein A2265_10795 [Bacteroidetes bacterium RIFOXYA12_FULL_33_9]OFY92116.1 MAG: hypothetical protein A2236_07665 [Bacteroidetes bacterium RIFOXYA2_FULL_33_7]